MTKQEVIGIIGLGAMGMMYARIFLRAGYEVICSDVSLNNLKNLRGEFNNSKLLKITLDNCEVAKNSSFLFYGVPLESLDLVLMESSQSIKSDTIVGGFGSVKCIEIELFKKYLSNDLSIITSHSLHAPKDGSLEDENLVLINVNGDQDDFISAKKIFHTLGSKIVEVKDGEEHDYIMADVQGGIHIILESMGSTWKSLLYVCEDDSEPIDFVDQVKFLISQRFFLGKSHVFGGISIYNEYTTEQILEYQNCLNELTNLVELCDFDNFSKILFEVREYLFKNIDKSKFLFGEELQDDLIVKNSHLSLFAKAYSWKKLNIDPYSHLDFSTPVYRGVLGLIEYIFLNDNYFNKIIKVPFLEGGLRNKILISSLEYKLNVSKWVNIIENKNLIDYKIEFDLIKDFMKNTYNFENAKKRSDLILDRVSISNFSREC